MNFNNRVWHFPMAWSCVFFLLLFINFSFTKLDEEKAPSTALILIGIDANENGKPLEGVVISIFQGEQLLASMESTSEKTTKIAIQDYNYQPVILQLAKEGYQTVRITNVKMKNGGIYSINITKGDGVLETKFESRIHARETIETTEKKGCKAKRQERRQMRKAKKTAGQK